MARSDNNNNNNNFQISILGCQCSQQHRRMIKYQFFIFGLQPDFNLKSNFHGKNGPSSPDFKKKKIPDRQIFMLSSSRQPRIQKDSAFFLLSYLVCSQIWGNHLMDDRQLSYIHKIEKKNPVHSQPCLSRYHKSQEAVSATSN